MDKLTICKKCGSDACYSQEVNDKITNYQCMGCGFISNSLMIKDSEFYKEQSEILPELYKDLFFDVKVSVTFGFCNVWISCIVNILSMQVSRKWLLP